VKTILRNLGVKITPHQIRHLAAKIVLDAQPGCLRAGPTVVGAHESENDHVLLRRRRH
jgi:hypothetical protein